jgi:hypothetical protein
MKELDKNRGSFSILVNSSDGFDDCWLPFFTLFTKYWPSCQAPIFLNTETKEWSYPKLSIYCTTVQPKGEKRLTWSECLIAALKKVDTPLVLYFQEDYFIHQPVRDEFIQAAVNYMLTNPEVKHIGLTRHGGRGKYDKHQEKWLHTIRQRAKYRVSTQAGLWRVDALMSYLRPEENGWMFEIFGTWRSHLRREIFLDAKFEEVNGGPAIDYLHTGIIKGKWLRAIQPVFEANNINIDYIKRGFYEPKHPLLHKTEVGRILLNKPKYFLNQIFARYLHRKSA